VDDVEVKLPPRVVEGSQRVVVAVLTVSQLGGDEDIFAGKTAVSYRGANTSFVTVGGCGVDVPIASRKRFGHASLRLLRRDLKDTVADLRDSHAVVEGDVRNRVHRLPPAGLLMGETLPARGRGCSVLSKHGAEVAHSHPTQ